MSERDPIWDALKQHGKEKFAADRGRFLADAMAKDDGGWTKHTEFHWSRTVAGQRLDYWPSRKKWQYQNEVSRGDVYSFIRYQKNRAALLKAVDKQAANDFDLR